MQNSLNRASQFKPFDALKGFKEALNQIDRIVDEKIFLGEDDVIGVNNKLLGLKIGDRALIKYYCNLEYIETVGIVKKIDKINKILFFANSKINFEDIININTY